jgi:1,4-alpha-glucan branching enzyme
MASHSLIRIPVIGASSVQIYYSPLPRTGDFNPKNWPHAPLTKLSSLAGEWWEINLESLDLQDGSYEYEFQVTMLDGSTKFIADPYAEELTKYAYYRGVFSIRNKQRYRTPFSWQGEIPANIQLSQNNKIVIYELPMRWIDAPPDGEERQIGLGTFDKALFEHLQYFKDIGINAIEILPAQDSPDTLSWAMAPASFSRPT